MENGQGLLVMFPITGSNVACVTAIVICFSGIEISRAQNDPGITQNDKSKQLEEERNLREQTTNNLKKVMLGILAYEEGEQYYPPPRASLDEKGNPLLSWRVLILPYLNEKELYKEFHLNEPWDSPHNKPLVGKMPSIFKDPHTNTEPGYTVFQAVVGQGLAFEPKGRYKSRDISDGRSTTVAIVEVVAENAVPWTKPADWEFDAQHPMTGLAAVETAQLFFVGFFDGHIGIYRRNCDPVAFGHMLTRKAGDSMDWDLSWR